MQIQLSGTVDRIAYILHAKDTHLQWSLFRQYVHRGKRYCEFCPANRPFQFATRRNRYIQQSSTCFVLRFNFELF